VIVQKIPSERKPDLAAFEHTLRQRQQARSHQPRSQEEIDDCLDLEKKVSTREFSLVISNALID